MAQQGMLVLVHSKCVKAFHSLIYMFSGRFACHEAGRIRTLSIAFYMDQANATLSRQSTLPSLLWSSWNDLGASTMLAMNTVCLMVAA